MTTPNSEKSLNLVHSASDANPSVPHMGVVAYLVNGKAHVRFHYDGVNYDLSAEEAQKLLIKVGALALILLLILAIASLANDKN